MQVTTTITTTVTDKQISELLCCAFEGGSNYWCMIENYRLAKGYSMDDFRVGGKHQDPGDYFHPCQLVPLHEGCSIVISCEDYTNDGNAWELDRECLERGLRLLSAQHPRHWADFIDDNSDAITGDVFLQLALFGEIVFE